MSNNGQCLDIKMSREPTIDLNKIAILTLLLIPLIIWTIADFKNIKLSEGTREAIHWWTTIASVILGVNYMTGRKNSVKSINNKSNNAIKSNDDIND